MNAINELKCQAKTNKTNDEKTKKKSSSTKPNPRTESKNNDNRIIKLQRKNLTLLLFLPKQNIKNKMKSITIKRSILLKKKEKSKSLFY